MCLFKVTKIYEPNDDMIVCYKTFTKISRSRVESAYKQYLFTVGRHYIAEKVDIVSLCGIMYESGFHAFVTREDAIRECFREDCVYEVHLWDIKAKGVQWRKDVIVGENMRIIRKVT